jgi:hypothetical protein
MKTYELFQYLTSDNAHAYAGRKLAEEMTRIARRIPNKLCAIQYKQHMREFNAQNTPSELEKKL